MNLALLLTPSPPRNRLPLDVLAELQLRHRRARLHAADGGAQHLPLPGGLRGLRLRHLLPGGAQGQAGHGEEELPSGLVTLPWASVTSNHEELGHSQGIHEQGASSPSERCLQI